MDYLALLRRRYACKEFNGELVNDEIIKNILEAGILTPSSLGLEPWEFWVVSKKEDLEKLKSCCNSKRQFETCGFSVLILVSNNYSSSSPVVIRALKRRLDYKAVLERYGVFLDSLKGEEARTYGSEQAHLACTNLVNAAMSYGVDSCIIGGFREECVAREFGVPEGLFCSLIVTFGYQKEEMKGQKIRFSFEEKVKFI